MWRDEIVEETRRVREEYAAMFDNDLEAIVRDLQKQQQRSAKKVIRLRKKEPEVLPQRKAS